MTSSANFSISVVIPTFNRASIINNTIDKILNQTQKPDEIIVVNDGSTDDTLSILKMYSENLNVITINNSGDLVARNTGLRAARGDLVAFCDDDDLWQDDFISSMSRFWEDYTKPMCAFSDFKEIVNGRWADRSKFETAPPDYWSGLEIVEGNYAQFTTSVVQNFIAFQPLFPSCLMVNRQSFMAIGGWDEGVSRMVGCDFATALRIAEHPPIGVLRHAAVGIRKHAGNISRDVQRMNLGDADVLSYVLSTRPGLAAYAEEIRRSIDARRLAAFDTAFSRRDFAAAEQIIALLSAQPTGLRHHLKRVITQLPPFLRDPVWRIVSRE